MRLVWRLSVILAGVLATMALGVAAAGFGAFYYLSPALPSVAEMREIPLQIPLRIYSRDGRLLEQIGEKRRIPADYDEIPRVVVEAFLAAEDDRFFEHPGFDYQGIARAAFMLIATGERAQGGSTITQQLARAYFLTNERSFVRKAKELILATQIESAFPKEEILALYLNKIFLGQRAYGVAAAAAVYFGKPLEELTVAEAATLAGLPKAPSTLNPVTNAQKATNRRSYVLRRMHELDFIDDAELEGAIATPMMSRLHGPAIDLRAPYVAEMVRNEMIKRFGNEAYTDGYQVVTTLDSRAQAAADSALRKALLTYDRRHGFRGAVATLDVDATIAGFEIEDSEEELEQSVVRTLALQNALSGFAAYRYLNPAVVLNTRTDNSAEFFLRDTGNVVVAWEKIQWAPHVNDNRIGDLPANVTKMLLPGDVVYLLDTKNGLQLAQLPEAQGAFVALDPKDGATVALSGGFDYFASKFNRAVQTRRQPGSSFKPFIYSAALENGFTASTIINDAPVVFEGAGIEESWRPENYSNKFYGPTRMREALVKSMNLVSVRILLKMGIRNALAHIKPFGFPDTALPADFSLALGSGGASPWQMATGFTVLANGGYSVQRYFIDKIIDADGNVIFQTDPITVCTLCADEWLEGLADNNGNSETLEIEQDSATVVPKYASAAEMMEQAGTWRPDAESAPAFWSDRNQAKRIITAENSYIIYDMMRDVIKRGTGRRVNELGRNDLAGKTGTSNNRRDAWFSGFNADLVGVAWVGFDEDSRSLGAGEEGSRTALPVWKDFMEITLDGIPEKPLRQPADIVSVRVAADTGKLATSSSEDALFEIFVAGTEPEEAAEDYGFAEDIFVEQGGDDNSIF
jgi:penicillin-binding protein 1A